MTDLTDTVSSGLDALMEHVANSNTRRGWAPAPLTNAKRAAQENDAQEEAKLNALNQAWWGADKHDRAYWHSVLDPFVSQETFEKIMKSMGLS